LEEGNTPRFESLVYFGPNEVRIIYSPELEASKPDSGTTHPKNNESLAARKCAQTRRKS
jgi:hypothetical protein